MAAFVHRGKMSATLSKRQYGQGILSKTRLQMFDCFVTSLSLFAIYYDCDF